MKYFFILLIIFTLAGCQQQAAVFERSLDVVAKNQDMLENESEFVEDIGGSGVSNDFDRVSNEDIGSEEINNVQSGVGGNASASEVFAIPENFDLPIKFSPQAPNAVWDDLHNEACEEAAMIIAAKYLKGEDLDKQIMEEEIQALIKWEEEQGYKIDVTAEETTEILKDYFGLKAEVSVEVTVERIKKELVLGNLIITPHAGRELGNPYYRRPGPLYHFLVIRGWTVSEFITNDPGTKRGEGYKYKFEKLIGTVHDWNGGEVETGERVMIVVEK